MHLASRRTALLAALAIAGCGGKVFVDGAGGGSATTGSGNGGGGTCMELAIDLTTKLQAAQTCDPTSDVLQCTDEGVILHDDCGCEVLPAEADLRAADASAAWDAFTAAGCMPFECFSCPAAPPAPWGCKGGRCVPE